jgi:hypothetical protein
MTTARFARCHDVAERSSGLHAVNLPFATQYAQTPSTMAATLVGALTATFGPAVYVIAECQAPHFEVVSRVARIVTKGFKLLPLSPKYSDCLKDIGVISENTSLKVIFFPPCSCSAVSASWPLSHRATRTMHPVRFVLSHQTTRYPFILSSHHKIPNPVIFPALLVSRYSSTRDVPPGPGYHFSSPDATLPFGMSLLGSYWTLMDQVPNMRF